MQAVRHFRLEDPNLTAKQLHERVTARPGGSELTLSKVKRMSSKVAKLDANTPAAKALATKASSKDENSTPQVVQKPSAPAEKPTAPKHKQRPTLRRLRGRCGTTLVVRGGVC